MNRVVFLIVILFTTQCFGGRFFGPCRCGPCEPCGPCFDPFNLCCFPCFDPCFEINCEPCEPCKPEPQAKLTPVPNDFGGKLPIEGKTSPLPKSKVIKTPLEGKTSPIIKEEDTSPLDQEVPTKFFDGTEEIKPELLPPLPAPFDDKWKDIGKLKLKIHYPYKVEEMQYMIARTEKGRFLNLPILNGVVPTVKVRENYIDVYYHRDIKATPSFWKQYNSLGYYQYFRQLDTKGWHVYKGQGIREWNHLKQPFKGVLHSAKRISEDDSNLRFLTVGGDIIIAKWSDLGNKDQTYIDSLYRTKLAKK